MRVQVYPFIAFDVGTDASPLSYRLSTPEYIEGKGTPVKSAMMEADERLVDKDGRIGLDLVAQTASIRVLKELADAGDGSLQISAKTDQSPLHALVEAGLATSHAIGPNVIQFTMTALGHQFVADLLS